MTLAFLSPWRCAGLRRRLAPLLAGSSCIVVGSAPGAKPVPADRVICVNGSGWIAAAQGTPIPDLTVLAGYALRPDSDVRLATQDALRGLRTRTLLFIETGCSKGLAVNTLARLGYQYDRLLTIAGSDRATISRLVAGKPRPPPHQPHGPSTGLFAVALALWAGARDVKMTGFSLAGGHAYIAGPTHREHVDADSWFLSRIADRFEIV